MSARPTLDTVLKAPATADGLGREDLHDLLTAATTVAAVLAARLQHLPAANGTAPTPIAAATEDQWLTVAETAQRLRKSRRWVYRRAKGWSFTKRLSERSLLVSEKGLDRWLSNPARAARSRK